MKHDLQRIVLAAVIPLFLLLILYILKFMEIGMDWDFTRLGVYPMEKRGVFGILHTRLSIAVSDIFLPTQSHCFFCLGACFTFTVTSHLTFFLPSGQVAGFLLFL